MKNRRHFPEARLLLFALPLETLWEFAQFPLYTVWQENPWNYILYSLVHCTVGDLLILLVSYELVALLYRARDWYRKRPILNALLFTALGAAYTIYSETVNTGPAGAWDYTEHMPIVPLLGIGLTPLLQWLLIPPLLLGFLRALPPSRPAHE